MALRLLALARRPPCARNFSSGLQAARPCSPFLGALSLAHTPVRSASLGRPLWLQPHRALSGRGTPVTGEKKEKEPEKPASAFSVASIPGAGGMRKNWEKIKDLWGKYGKIFAIYWGTMYVTNLGMVYVVIKVAGVDGLEILRYFGADNYVDTSWWSPDLINFLVAAEVNEWLEIVRLPFAAATTPRLARYLRGEPEPDAEGTSATTPDDNKGAGPKA